MLLADRARSQHAHPLAGHVPAAHSRGLSRPATTAATVRYLLLALSSLNLCDDLNLCDLLH